MKIGIVTFHSGRNYGAVLQAYALQTYLQKAGHEPFFVNHKFRWNMSLCDPRTWLARTPREVIYKLNDNILKYIFYKFRKKHLILGSSRYIRLQELIEKPPVADAYICGSDQIWNPNCINENDGSVVWLDFGNDNVLRISYAASFSVPNLDAVFRERWSGYAQRFHAISVREKDGVDLMKKLGRDDAVWVPDPTLLLDASDYDFVELKSKEKYSPYFFSYMLGTDNNELSSKVVNTVEKNLGVPPYVSRPYSFSHNLFHSSFIGPSEWLSRLHSSVFVVTNSFHGLMFSLIFSLPFIILLREQDGAKMNSRVLSILAVVGLQNRAVSAYDGAQVERLCCEEIDWDAVHTRLSTFREEGRRFIREALA